MSSARPEAVLRKFLERSTGFEIPDDRWRFLAPRFLARLSGRGFADVEAYVDYLHDHPHGRTEQEELFELLTVRKTSFFRNPASFDALAQEVFPSLLERGPGGLSVWSAGCSTGEEAYTVAMVAQTVLADRPCYVLATDIVKEALERARRGVYSTQAVRGIPPEYRHFFSKGGGHAELSADVREMVDFVEHNLVHDTLPAAASGSWDIVFCRNVFIYFSEAQARSVLRRFHSALSPGGVLFLGHAEVFPGLERDFEVVFWGDTYYYRKREDPRAAPVRASQAPMTQPQRRRPAPTEARSTRDPRADATRAQARDRSDEDPTTRLRRRLSESGVWRPAAGDTPTRAFRREGTAARPYDLVAQAESQRGRGDLEGAARTLRAAISRAPRWASPRLELARVHRQRGDLEHAARELVAACESEPLRTESHVLLGEVRAEQGDHARAEVSLRRALYLDPQRLDARYVLAQTFRARDAKVRACRELRNILRTTHASEGRVTFPEGVSKSELVRRCQAEIGEMGGNLEDSGIWPVA